MKFTPWEKTILIWALIDYIKVNKEFKAIGQDLIRRLGDRS